MKRNMRLEAAELVLRGEKKNNAMFCTYKSAAQFTEGTQERHAGKGLELFTVSQVRRRQHDGVTHPRGKILV